jgi:hypothetical protein
LSNNTIRLNRAAIFKSLLGLTAFLLAASLLGQLGIYIFGLEIQGLVRFFDVSHERNIPTFFTVFTLLLAGGVLFCISVLSHSVRDRFRWHWTILSVGFLAMAYDEGFQVHEYFIAPMRKLLGNGDLGIFNYAWVIPGMLLVLFLGFFFLKFLQHLPVRTRKRFVLAAALYLGGCLGMELVGSGYDAAHGYENLTYNLISTLEEGLEMAGLVFFIFSLLEYAESRFATITLQLARVGSEKAGPRNPI